MPRRGRSRRRRCSFTTGSERAGGLGRLDTTLVNRFRLVRFDLRGHGASPLPTGFEWSLDAAVDDLEAVASAAGADRFHLVGESLGGTVALAFAARRPDRVLSLTVSNGTHLGGAIENLEPWERPHPRGRDGGLVGAHDEAALLRRRPHPSDGAMVRGAAGERGTERDPRPARPCWRAPTSPPSSPGWRARSCSCTPTRARSFPSRRWRRSGRALPDARLQVFAHARHGLPYSHAAECAAALARFLTGSPRTPPDRTTRPFLPPPPDLRGRLGRFIQRPARLAAAWGNGKPRIPMRMRVADDGPRREVDRGGAFGDCAESCRRAVGLGQPPDHLPAAHPESGTRDFKLRHYPAATVLDEIGYREAPSGASAMTLLVLGLTVFVLLHLIPSVPPLRAALVAGMGEMAVPRHVLAPRAREYRDGGVGLLAGPVRARLPASELGPPCGDGAGSRRGGAVCGGQHADPHPSRRPASDAARTPPLGRSPISRRTATCAR